AKLALSQLSYGPPPGPRLGPTPGPHAGDGRDGTAGNQAPPGSSTKGPRFETWVVTARKGCQDGGSAAIQPLPAGSLVVRRRQQATGILRKEVIQPQVPLRLPCYDFTPVADLTVAGCLLAVSAPSSGKANSHGVTGGVYKARERIHRGMLIRDY